MENPSRKLLNAYEANIIDRIDDEIRFACNSEDFCNIYNELFENPIKEWDLVDYFNENVHGQAGEVIDYFINEYLGGHDLCEFTDSSYYQEVGGDLRFYDSPEEDYDLTTEVASKIAEDPAAYAELLGRYGIDLEEVVSTTIADCLA